MNDIKVLNTWLNKRTYQLVVTSKKLREAQKLTDEVLKQNEELLKLCKTFREEASTARTELNNLKNQIGEH